MQIFVASQNPLLIDRIGFRSPEQVRCSLVVCKEQEGQVVWEHPEPREAEDVYRAHEVGLQNLSEVLWQKGLW